MYTKEQIENAFKRYERNPKIDWKNRKVPPTVENIVEMLEKEVLFTTPIGEQLGLPN